MLTLQYGMKKKNPTHTIKMEEKEEDANWTGCLISPFAADDSNQKNLFFMYFSFFFHDMSTVSATAHIKKANFSFLHPYLRVFIIIINNSDVVHCSSCCLTLLLMMLP